VINFLISAQSLMIIAESDYGRGLQNGLR